MGGLYDVALWLRFDSAGAEYAAELSEEHIVSTCQQAGFKINGDLRLGALLTLMLGAGVSQIAAGAVQGRSESGATWFSEVDLASRSLKGAGQEDACWVQCEACEVLFVAAQGYYQPG